MQEIIIKNNAIFIADAHENENRRGFWEFLQALKKGEIQTSQIFLMGDIFDLLVYEISATHNFAKSYIQILEELAKNIEIIYLEGNHDFNLANFFHNVKVFNISSQPLNAILHLSEGKNLKVKIAHGDIFLPKFLQFILGLLRNKYLLFFLNFLNKISFNFICKSILKKQLAKNLFYKINDFDLLAKKRFLMYDCDLVIEGHYHQNFIIKEKNINYINLVSFAYKRSFYVVQFHEEVKFQEQELR